MIALMGDPGAETVVRHAVRGTAGDNMTTMNPCTTNRDAKTSRATGIAMREDHLEDAPTEIAMDQEDAHAHLADTLAVAL